MKAPCSQTPNNVAPTPAEAFFVRKMAPVGSPYCISLPSARTDSPVRRKFVGALSSNVLATTVLLEQRYPRVKYAMMCWYCHNRLTLSNVFS